MWLTYLIPTVRSLARRDGTPSLGAATVRTLLLLGGFAVLVAWILVAAAAAAATGFFG